MITVRAPLRMWTGDDGSSHFINIAEELSGEIRAQALAVRRGFGSVRVQATIDDISWRTSLFPRTSGGYFLPVKIEVCRKASIAAGDDVTVTLDLL